MPFVMSQGVQRVMHAATMPVGVSFHRAADLAVKREARPVRTASSLLSAHRCFAAGRIVLYSSPSVCRALVTCPFQSWRAAGFAGLGCSMLLTVTAVPCIAISARRFAKLPTPMTCCACNCATVWASASSQRTRRCAQFIGCEVFAGLVEERQWTIIHHEITLEKAFRRAVMIARPAPQQRAARLAAFAGIALHRSFRMLARRVAHGAVDTQPVAHHFDIAERHAGLHHTPRPRVHADEYGFAFALAVARHITLVGLPRVLERVVDVGGGERQRGQRVA